MALEDRLEIVSVVEETYGLLGRVLSTDVPSAVLPGIRPDIMGQIRNADLGSLVTDAEMLPLLQTAYLDLAGTVVFFAASSFLRSVRLMTCRFSRHS